MSDDLISRLKSISDSPGVYLMKNIEGDIIYVGKAKNLKKRVSQYFSNKKTDIKTEHLVSKIKDFETIVVNNEVEAFLLENNLIKNYKPKYNISLKDDKTYPYLKITNNYKNNKANAAKNTRCKINPADFPYITKTRSYDKNSGEYFGPYSNAKAVADFIKMINKIFKIRTCNDTKFKLFASKGKPCVYYQINRCFAPCCGYIAPEDYNNLIKEARMVLQGKNNQIIKDLKKMMDKYVKEQNFEAAIKIRDKINSLSVISATQSTVTADGKNIDAVGCYSENNASVIDLIMIRNGKMIDSKNYYFKNVYLTDKEMISSFLDQYYVLKSNGENMNLIPDEILIPFEINIENRNILIEFFKKTLKKIIKLTIPKNEKNKNLIVIAINNAKNNFYEKNIIKANIGLYSIDNSNNNKKNGSNNIYNNIYNKIYPENNIENKINIDDNININANKQLNNGIKGSLSPQNFGNNNISIEENNNKNKETNFDYDYNYGRGRLLESLKQYLNLKKIPQIIECFDISNISGTYPVASKAVFKDGLKETSLYRKYKIRSKNTPDDYAMMYEVITRRFKNAVDGKDPLPDLIMADGGKGQLNVFMEVKKEFKDYISEDDMPDIISIAKVKENNKYNKYSKYTGYDKNIKYNKYTEYNRNNKNEKENEKENEKNSENINIIENNYEDDNIYKKNFVDKIYLPNRKNAVNPPLNLILFLMSIRDEAHRFAITFHSSLKRKSVVTSELINIKGVGLESYKKLLDSFGDVNKIKQLSIEELSKCVNSRVAKIIYEHFNN
ncbi:MAG: excinuclease ABC subunit UvrC [Deltaproteobacteria bacterium]|nr:excinuclease ABC subunit UvrC [Deltaproteobacteria bacterium]